MRKGLLVGSRTNMMRSPHAGVQRAGLGHCGALLHASDVQASGCEKMDVVGLELGFWRVEV